MVSQVHSFYLVRYHFTGMVSQVQSFFWSDITGMVSPVQSLYLVRYYRQWCLRSSHFILSDIGGMISRVHSFYLVRYHRHGVSSTVILSHQVSQAWCLGYSHFILSDITGIVSVTRVHHNIVSGITSMVSRQFAISAFLTPTINSE